MEERGTGGPSLSSVYGQAFHCLQCVEEVVELSTLEQHTCLSRASRIGDTFRDGLKLDVVKPPLEEDSLTYNITLTTPSVCSFVSYILMCV